MSDIAQPKPVQQKMISESMDTPRISSEQPVSHYSVVCIVADHVTVKMEFQMATMRL